jgi:hypothetical protein
MQSVLRKRLSYEQRNAAINPKNAGENGLVQNVGDSLLALYNDLNRKMTERKFNHLFTKCTNELQVSSQGDPQLVADLFVLAFQTRDCRGCGKGERVLFYELFRRLNHIYPQTVRSLIPLIQEYGYFQDYFNLLQSDEPPRLPPPLSSVPANRPPTEHESSDNNIGVHEDNQQPLLVSQSKGSEWTPFLKIEKSSRLSHLLEDIALQNNIIDFIVQQLQEDEKKVDEFNSSTSSNPTPLSISLCAKYAPREGKSFAKQKKNSYCQLLSALFPNELQQSQQKKKYRQLITKLSGYLNVVETSMCSSQFSSIDFNKVPSLCLKKYRKAWLNEKLEENPITKEEMITGNRFSDDPDRIACRKQFLDALYSPEGCLLKENRLFPHAIIKEWIKEACSPRYRKKLSPVEDDLLQEQWNDIKQRFLRKMKEKSTEIRSVSDDSAVCLDLRRLVPLVDVSGSMDGLAMDAAVSLGLLISEINHPAFRNRILTFDTTPSWVDLSDCSHLRNKVTKVVNILGGDSMNIEAAMDPIEAVIVEQNLKAEDIPDLIIFSDMQFNEACNDLTSFPIWNIFSGLWSMLTGSSSKESYDYQLLRIQKRFHELGIRLTGKPFRSPKIIFWNLRDDKSEQVHHESVQMLSGFSPSLFNSLLDGTYDKRTEIEEGKKQRVHTPHQVLRKLLDNERYFPIRKILSESQEGALANYSFSSDLTFSSSREKKRKITS